VLGYAVIWKSFQYFNLSLKEKQIIDDFVKYVSITSSSQKRLENNKRTLTTFRYVVQKNFNDINLKDLRDYLGLLKSSKNTNATQNEYKASIKRFLRWKFKDWSDRFQNLEDIKLHFALNEERINAETLVSKEDIEKIVQEEKKTYWKAFFLTLYESGLRPVELRNLNWKNIKFNVDGNISEINVFATKTHKARSVYVSEATFYLQKLKEKRKDFTNPLVFPSLRDPSMPVSKGVLSLWLTNISKRVLGRAIFPYILRHSRATELYTNASISDAVAQKFLGHSKSMKDVYTHLSNKDVKEAVGKTIYKFEDIAPEEKHELQEKIERLEKQNNEMAKKWESKFNEFSSGLKKELMDIETERAKRWANKKVVGNKIILEKKI